MSVTNSPETNTVSPGRILIVDDLAANVRLLAAILKTEGFEVETAGGGQQALDSIERGLPDVVLLDVMMPGMDGFEVCRRIKANERTAFLPVVMVTALQESNDRINALEAGADDFLTKPVDEVEVVARVKSLVRVKRQRDELENAFLELKRLESMRDSMAAMVVHDLRTPLTTLLGPLEMLAGEQFGTLTGEQREILSMSTRSGYRLLSLVNELLDVNKMESGEMAPEWGPVEAQKIVDEALEQVALVTHNHKIEIRQEVASDVPEFQGDDDLLRRIMTNLIGNAIKFTPEPGEIVIMARRVAPDETPVALPGVLFAVRDTGEGIPPEAQGHIFEKFGQVESRKAGRKMSTGLGLTFCKLAVEAQGGQIWVDSLPGEGSTFSFVIPIQR